MARRISSGRAHLGVGVPAPFRPVGGRIPWARYEEAVERSIVAILETTPGERVMLAGFGAGLHARVFEPNSPATHRTVEHAVQEALVRWEPRIDVERVTVTASIDEPNLLLVDLDYVVRRTNKAENRVFPLYLTEGV